MKTKLMLLNVNRDGWHSGNMIYDMKVVQKACDTKIYGPGWPGYQNADIVKIVKQLYGNEKPDVIYSYFTPNERVSDVYMQHYGISEKLRFFPTNFDKITGVKKIFALSDFWARGPAQFSHDLTNSTFEYCFCCFTPPFTNPDHFYSFFDSKIRSQIKFFPMPRCVDKDCFKDYGLPKKYDVITLGSMIRFYPLRVHMHNVLQANASKLSINYRNYPHCGVNFNHSDFVRDNYAKAINSSKILLSCGGRYHVAYNKIFEAMGCKTLYIGEKPYGEKELHMEDGVNYVAVDKDNFVDKILYHLKNPEIVAKIVNNAHDTFIKYHHIDARAVDFANLIEKVMNENSH